LWPVAQAQAVAAERWSDIFMKTQQLKKQTLAAMVCCCGKDEPMLAIFVKRWREIYPDVPLYLANDELDPVADDLGLPQLPMRWEKGAAFRIVEALLAIDADIVAKLDVDAWHISPFLFEPFAEKWVVAAGVQWLNYPGQFLGIAYAVRKKVLSEVALKTSCKTLSSSQDDTTIHNAIRSIYPNGVYLFPNSHVKRADTWTSRDKARLVHCGLHGKDEAGRMLAWREMVTLAAGSPVVAATESVWIGLSVMPNRIVHVKETLASLLANRVKPTGIVVAVPHIIYRTGETYDEEQVAKIAAMSPLVHVVRCEDVGPMTKYIELAKHATDPSCLCIAVDDDNFYSPQLIERMMTEMRALPAKTVLANRVVKLRDTPLPEGWRGVAFRRGELPLERLERLMGAIGGEALLADDAVLGWFLRMHGLTVQKSVRPIHSKILDHNSDDTALHKIGKGHIDRYGRVLGWLSQNTPDLLAEMECQIAEPAPGIGE
jgi:hypothetical protein